MNTENIVDSLRELGRRPDFRRRLGVEAANWCEAYVDSKLAEAILSFIEDNPDLDYGIPGPLAFLLERAVDCRQLVLDSLSRKPTVFCVRMWIRQINGAREPSDRLRLAMVLERLFACETLDNKVFAEIDAYFRSLEDWAMDNGPTAGL